MTTNEPTTTLTHEPVVVERPAVHYVGHRAAVTMDTMNEIADRIPGLIGWLGDHGVTPAGAPFLRYHLIDMMRELVVEAGVPVPHALPDDPDAEVRAGILPPGRYVTLAQVGHPDALVEVTGEFLAWADQRGLAWDVRPTAAGDAWGCRLEFYHTDPREEPDMNVWTTELAFRLKD